MQKYADIAMQNGVATEAAGRPSGGFCFVRATPPPIAEKAAERDTSALSRIPRGVARRRVFSSRVSCLVSRVERFGFGRETRDWRREKDFGLQALDFYD